MSQTLVFTIFGIIVAGMCIDVFMWVWQRTIGPMFAGKNESSRYRMPALDPTSSLKKTRDNRAWIVKQKANKIKCPGCGGWALPVWGSEKRYRCDKCSKLFEHDPPDNQSAA